MGKIEVNIGMGREEEHEDKGMGEKFQEVHPAMVAGLMTKLPIGSLSKIVMKITGSEVGTMDDAMTALGEMEEAKLTQLKMAIKEKLGDDFDKEEEEPDEDDEKRMKFLELEEKMKRFSRQKSY